MQEIIIEYTPTIADHKEAYTTYEKTTVGGKLDNIVAIILIITGVLLGLFAFYNNMLKELIIYPIVLIAIGIFDMMGFMDFGKWLYLIRLKMSIKSKSKHKVSFSENGLYFATNNIKSEIAWEFYQSFLESKNTLILIYGHRQFSVIPKSSFKDSDYTILKDFLLQRTPFLK